MCKWLLKKGDLQACLLASTQPCPTCQSNDTLILFASAAAMSSKQTCAQTFLQHLANSKLQVLPM